MLLERYVSAAYYARFPKLKINPLNKSRQTPLDLVLVNLEAAQKAVPADQDKINNIEEFIETLRQQGFKTSIESESIYRSIIRRCGLMPSSPNTKGWGKRTSNSDQFSEIRKRNKATKKEQKQDGITQIGNLDAEEVLDYLGDEEEISQAHTRKP